MKKLSIVVVLILITGSVFSQTWEDLLPQEKKEAGTLTFFEIQKAFEQYWQPYNVEGGYFIDENGDKKKASGWKNFRRWEWFWQNRVNKFTGEFPKTNAYEQYLSYINKNPQYFNKNSLNGDWINLGITQSEGGYDGLGRFNVVEFHPTNENIFWAGSPSGGLWQTSDGGDSWFPLTDNNLVIGVSDIAIPTDFETTNTMYILTGDRDEGSMWALGGASNDNHSIGILKSTDGGSTWQNTALNYDVTEKALLKRLIIHPLNSEILYCASSKGIYKTTDGGLSWNLMKVGSFYDLEFKPQDEDNTLYASTSGTIYKTTDAGESWTTVYSTPNQTSRTDIAVTPANPNMIYAISADNNNGFGGLYKSIDSGNSFEIAFAAGVDGHNITGYYIEGNYDTWNGQAKYDLALAVSPTNANELWVGGINAWKSIDGGYNWECKTHWWGEQDYTAVHADVHYIEYQNENTVYEVNDGGIYKVTDGGETWTDITNGTAISQLYRFSGNVENTMLAGLQDNGGKMYKNGVWSEAFGGDGMECVVDYDNEDIQYGAIFYGRIFRTTDNWETEPTYITGSIYGANDGYWVTPYVMDPNNSQTLYVGVDKIFKTTDRGDSWTELTGVSSVPKLRSMATCQSNSNVLYVADPTNVWKTTDAGENWELITNNLSSVSYNITYITINQNNADNAWVTFGGYNEDRVYETTDGGATWQNISVGLPNLPVMTIVHNKLNTTETEIYAGTDRGVYLKVGNATWIPFMENLPNVVISELEICYNESTPENSTLRAATYGRGVWESDLYDYNSDMIYFSSELIEIDKKYAEPGNSDEEIIGIQIITLGTENPINLTNVTIQLTGTTDIADIDNINIYYTATANEFSNTNLFATASPATGEISFAGNQELLMGGNYLWITYDIAEDATTGNYVNADLVSVAIDNGDAQLHNSTNTSDGLLINYIYCEASSNAAVVFFQNISNFHLRNINNDSEATGYSDFRHLSTELALADTYNFTLTNGQGNPSDNTRCAVWVDWNIDGDFEDENELAFIADEAQDIFEGEISVPYNAKLGLSTLRIRIWDTNDEPITQCGISNYGEVEDYSVNLVELVDITENKQLDIFIYPNPNKGSFYVDCRLVKEEDIKLEITDLTGKIISKQNLNSEVNFINIKNLTKGIYIINIKYGNKSINEKIIVK